MESVRGGSKYYIALFGFCSLAFFSIILVHIMSGRSLIWGADGLPLYYNFFLYEGEWIRNIVSSILNGSFDFPMYSFELGYGVDILTTMGGCLNDPFNLVSALCPKRYAEYVFEFLIYLRFLLTGFAFSYYSFNRGRARWATLVGSICYVLCGYVVFWGVLRHPNFINFAILLPLILCGSDRIMSRRSPSLFIAGYFLLFFFSLYFTYMMIIINVIYFLISFFYQDNKKEQTIKQFAILLCRFVLYGLIAALLAAITIIPMFLVLTSMGRIDLERNIPQLESISFYAGYASNFIGGHITRRSLVIGAAPTSLVLAFLSGRKVLKKQQWRPWTMGFFLCVAGSLIPFVGSLFNGFGYITDRYLIVLGFCVGNMATLVLSKLRYYSRRQWIVFSCLCIFVALWATAYAVYMKSAMSIIAIAAFAVSSVAILFIHKRRVRAIGIAFVVLTIFFNGLLTSIYNSPLDEDYADEFVEAGEAFNRANTVPYEKIQANEIDSYRIDRADVYGMRNQLLLSGLKGIDYYSSYYNQNVDDANYSLGISNHSSNYIFNGVDSRFALENLLGVKYFIVNQASKDSNDNEIKHEDQDSAPYSYEYIHDLGISNKSGPFALFESKLALPLAFTYNTACSESEYNKLNMIERQELLTTSCVLPEEAIDAEEDIYSEQTTVEQKYEISKQNGVRITDKGIEVFKSNGKLVLKFQGISDAENYVVFDNLNFEAMPLAHQRKNNESAGEVESESVELAASLDELLWKSESDFDIIIKGGGKREVLNIPTEKSNMYGGKKNWAVNLGYHEKAVKEISISFKIPGYYTWDKLGIISQPVKPIEMNLKKLKESNKASIEFNTNEMKIEVAPEEGEDERYTFISVPYSSGWSATLDGEPVDIQRADIGFMAIAMDGNAHQIELTYCTPGLKAGIICSIIGVFCLVLLIVFRELYSKERLRRKTKR